MLHWKPPLFQVGDFTAVSSNWMLCYYFFFKYLYLITFVVVVYYHILAHQALDWFPKGFGSNIGLSSSCPRCWCSPSLLCPFHRHSVVPQPGCMLWNWSGIGATIPEPSRHRAVLAVPARLHASSRRATVALSPLLPCSANQPRQLN